MCRVYCESTKTIQQCGYLNLSPSSSFQPIKCYINFKTLLYVVYATCGDPTTMATESGRGRGGHLNKKSLEKKKITIMKKIYLRTHNTLNTNEVLQYRVDDLTKRAIKLTKNQQKHLNSYDCNRLHKYGFGRGFESEMERFRYLAKPDQYLRSVSQPY